MDAGQMKARGPQDESERRQLVLMLLARLRCAGCGKPFQAHDFALLERRQDVWMLGVECRHCGDSAHVIVALHPATQPEAVTDLMPEERGAADDWPPITVDDVLDIHELLEAFDGDFQTLLMQ